MKLVADTSVFLAVALGEPERPRIIELTAGYGLVAPEVLPFEVGNALIALLKKGVLRAEDVPRVWTAVAQIDVELRTVDFPTALEIAIARGLYAYDACFLECAARLRLPLLTLDRRMQRAAEEMGLTALE
jgi:predicted nucleic acid-binding protein